MTDDPKERKDSRGKTPTGPLPSPLPLALTFLVFLTVFEYYFFFPKVSRFIFLRHVENGDLLTFAGFSVLSLASATVTFLFLWLAFRTKRHLNLVYLVVFAFAVMVEYGIYSAFGRFSTLGDLASMLFSGVDRQMAGEAIAHYFEPASLIPAGMFAAILMYTGKRGKAGLFSLSALLFASTSFFAAATYFTTNNFYAPSLSNMLRTAVSYPTGWYIGTRNGPPEGLVYAAPRESPSFTSGVRPANNIVFIVDESVRGDRLSINGYPYTSTPTLDKMIEGGTLINWGIASSGTTCSNTSNQLLLTGLNALPDKRFEIYSRPTIFQYAKAMGYTTHYYDAHTSIPWLGKASDLQHIDHRTTADDLNADFKYERDAEIARRVRVLLRSSRGNFIWIHKYGTHLMYENSFPNDAYGVQRNAPQIEYDPDQPIDALQQTYDRAITYNLESFFSELFRDGTAPLTYYIYTSDHGQTLKENGAAASHCGETRPEAIVPLFIAGEVHILPHADIAFPASHFNIFATLLDIMGYPADERRFDYSISLFKATYADRTPRNYFSGPLQNADRHDFDRPTKPALSPYAKRQ
jgi:glucan phosphoethanolaminetransferase (alkaline phosphatase superfamily)